MHGIIITSMRTPPTDSITLNLKPYIVIAAGYGLRVLRFLFLGLGFLGLGAPGLGIKLQGFSGFRAKVIQHSITDHSTADMSLQLCKSRNKKNNYATRGLS